MVNEDKQISGIGGFLAIIIFSMIVLIPTFGVIDLIKSFEHFGKNTSLDKINIITGIFELIGIILNISAGFKLYKKFEKTSVSYTLKVIWFNYFFSNLMIVIILSYFLNQNLSHKVFFDVFFYGILLSTVLTIYFKNSKRVKNTYL